MKKVVLQQPKPENITPVADVCLDLFYGVRMLDGRSGIVSRRSFDYGNFFLAACNKITNGNNYSCFDSTSLSGCVRSILAAGNEVQEFDSQKELFAWLAK